MPGLSEEDAFFADQEQRGIAVLEIRLRAPKFGENSKDLPRYKGCKWWLIVIENRNLAFPRRHKGRLRRGRANGLTTGAWQPFPPSVAAR